MRYSLREDEIKEIIKSELDKSPDLKYYINNEYFNDFVELLIDGICKAIAANTKHTIEKMENEVRRTGRAWR